MQAHADDRNSTTINASAHARPSQWTSGNYVWIESDNSRRMMPNANQCRRAISRQVQAAYCALRQSAFSGERRSLDAELNNGQNNGRD